MFRTYNIQYTPYIVLDLQSQCDLFYAVYMKVKIFLTLQLSRAPKLFINAFVSSPCRGCNETRAGNSRTFYSIGFLVPPILLRQHHVTRVNPRQNVEIAASRLYKEDFQFYFPFRCESLLFNVSRRRRRRDAAPFLVSHSRVDFA